MQEIRSKVQCSVKVATFYLGLKVMYIMYCFFSRIQQVCDTLESHIDPFDLDVFTPHLNSNLNRLSQRTSVSMFV